MVVPSHVAQSRNRIKHPRLESSTMPSITLIFINNRTLFMPPRFLVLGNLGLWDIKELRGVLAIGGTWGPNHAYVPHTILGKHPESCFQRQEKLKSVPSMTPSNS